MIPILRIDAARALRALPRSGLAAFALALFIAAPAPAQGEGGDPRGRGVNSSADDETIGTLPILGGESEIDLVELMTSPRFGLAIEGQYHDVLSAIVAVGGRAVATMELVDEAAQTYRLVVYGSPRLVLDRELVEDAGLRIEVHAPQALVGAALTVGYGGRTTSTTVTREGALPVPLGWLIESGRLLGRTVDVGTQAPTGETTHARVRTTRRFVLIELVSA